MEGLGLHKPLVSRPKLPFLALVDSLPCPANFSRPTISPSLRCRKILKFKLAHGTVRAQASNVGIGPGDYGSKKESDDQNVFGGSPVNDDSSKAVKQPPHIPYPISIALVLSGCALVFSLIAFLKGGPSSILEAIAKSGFTAAFTLIFVSEIGDKLAHVPKPKMPKLELKNA